jgi:hypothetical protein
MPPVPPPPAPPVPVLPEPPVPLPEALQDALFPLLAAPPVELLLLPLGEPAFVELPVLVVPELLPELAAPPVFAVMSSACARARKPVDRRAVVERVMTAALILLVCLRMLVLSLKCDAL